MVDGFFCCTAERLTSGTVIPFCLVYCLAFSGTAPPLCSSKLWSSGRLLWCLEATTTAADDAAAAVAFLRHGSGGTGFEFSPARQSSSLVFTAVVLVSSTAIVSFARSTASNIPQLDKGVAIFLRFVGILGRRLLLRFGQALVHDSAPLGRPIRDGGVDRGNLQHWPARRKQNHGR